MTERKQLSTYKEFSVGDYVTAYTKGIHRIDKIIDRTGEYGTDDSPVVELSQVLTGDFKMGRGNKSACDIFWCKKVNKEDLISSLKEKLNEQIKTISLMLI